MTVGFLVVDKPSGCTSRQVVDEVRRASGIRKAGHAGTLDPMATGVVVVALGRATRLIRFLQELEKEYLATACLGVATDTLDADGAVVSREPMEVTPAEVEEAASRLVGTILQTPPMVSAVKVGGQRLYELARQGTEVDREARPVQVHALDVLDVSPGPYPEVELRVVCGKGTYVRVLADDLARALGGRAHLTTLRRTRIGSLSVDRYGTALDDLEDTWEDALLAPADGLADLPGVSVDEAVPGVANGMRLAPSPAPEVPDGVPFRVEAADGRLLAVYANRGGSAVPEVVVA